MREYVRLDPEAPRTSAALDAWQLRPSGEAVTQHPTPFSTADNQPAAMATGIEGLDALRDLIKRAIAAHGSNYAQHFHLVTNFTTSFSNPCKQWWYDGFATSDQWQLKTYCDPIAKRSENQLPDSHRLDWDEPVGQFRTYGAPGAVRTPVRGTQKVAA